MVKGGGDGSRVRLMVSFFDMTHILKLSISRGKVLSKRDEGKAKWVEEGPCEDKSHLNSV